MYVNIAVEDPLSNGVLTKILSQSGHHYVISNVYMKNGCGYLKKNINAFNSAAKVMPWLVLTDLDRLECPPVLINQWLPHGKHDNLIFRIAVREVEAWVLAHRQAFLEFLGIKNRNLSIIPNDVDSIPDPKRYLIDIVKKSPKRELRSAIVPPPNSGRTQGPDYNSPLLKFVKDSWDTTHAMACSNSLARAVSAIKKFKPARHSQG
ncbi:MAG: hypothetical protein HY886_06915 [Deltaproteobacteria bacterium]|nr:hypothetical protein [Deltaproteobacteria bacterium]